MADQASATTIATENLERTCNIKPSIFEWNNMYPTFLRVRSKKNYLYVLTRLTITPIVLSTILQGLF